VDGVVMAPLGQTLGESELRSRAARIKIVLSDVDGVLTDAGVYYSDQGEVMKRFSLRDGMGVERLRDAGIESGIITRERSKSVEKRAEKLKLPHVIMGIWDKRAELAPFLEKARIELDQLAYIGDDVNDLGLLRAVSERGLCAAPLDAMPEVVRAVHYQTEKPGGHGAFRDFAEWILGLRAERSTR
jgi:3-deoxy-D-manno-octulosonate 8-phosphate phosphatase (KDO 8-P phosphatase)